MVVGAPTRILHFYIPFAYLFIYMVFSLIYWAVGGKTSGGDTAIYPILDWDNLRVTLPFIVCCAVFSPLMQVCSVADSRCSCIFLYHLEGCVRSQWDEWNHVLSRYSILSMGWSVFSISPQYNLSCMFDAQFAGNGTLQFTDIMDIMRCRRKK